MCVQSLKLHRIGSGSSGDPIKRERFCADVELIGKALQLMPNLTDLYLRVYPHHDEERSLAEKILLSHDMPFNLRRFNQDGLRRSTLFVPFLRRHASLTHLETGEQVEVPIDPTLVPHLSILHARPEIVRNLLRERAIERLCVKSIPILEQQQQTTTPVRDFEDGDADSVKTLKVVFKTMMLPRLHAKNIVFLELDIRWVRLL